MKNILLIHGFEGSRAGNWFAWLEKELSDAGYRVVNKTWPDPARPNLEKVMRFLREQTADFTENDIIVGHSLGAYFALKLAEERKFGALYLIAPAIGNLPYEKYRESWKRSDIDALENTVGNGFDLSKIKADKKIAIFSEDDPWIPMQDTESLLEDSFDIIRKKDCGHFQDSQYQFLLDIILKDTKN